MARVSILVTVFNREPYLEETLRSIAESSFEDWEAIVVDDQSTDASLEIAQQFAAGDVRFRVFRNEKNLGDYGNRNQAASYATGTYLKYLDADDVLYPHSLQTMVDVMETQPDAALALSANKIDPLEPYPVRFSPEQFFPAHFLGTSPIGVGPSAAIIRRSCFEEVGGFSGRQFVGDTELWLKLAERWPVINLPPALVWWRQHPGQQMQLEISKPEVLNVRYHLALETIRETSHLSDAQRKHATRRLKTNHARTLMSYAIRQRQLGTACRLISNAGLNPLDLFHGLRGYR